MNAFRDILGGVGRAADTVLLGGAIGRNRAENRFADYLGQGDLDAAQDLALRRGSPQAFQAVNMARQQQQQRAQVEAAQVAEQNKLFAGLSIGLSEISDPNARRMAFEAMKPGLSQRFGLDDEALSQVPLDDPNALRLFGQQFIAPEEQVDQRLTAQQQAEAARSNRATEGLRGQEIGVSQSRVGLDRERLGEDRRQFDERQQAEQRTDAPKNDLEAQQRQNTLNTWEQAKAALSDALDNSNTGPFFGRLPAVRGPAQTAEGAIATLAPVLKQIFRVSGEGVFTDKDQQLLLDMAPKRTDVKEARDAKLEFIDRIIRAKLGVEQAPQQASEPDQTGQQVGQPLSADELAELEQLRREFGGQ